MVVSLHDALRSSYGDKKAREQLLANGYNYDNSLSNGNQQVWYSPDQKKLLFNVAGTHNLKDWGTDLWLGLGGLKNTNRYKEADKKLAQAKQKYGVQNATITGHSLGGSIAQNIKKKGDQSYALDSGYTIGQKTRTKGGESHNYRTSGDIVSALSGTSKNIKTLKNPNIKTGILPIDGLLAHDVGNIKNQPIYV